MADEQCGSFANQNKSLSRGIRYRLSPSTPPYQDLPGNKECWKSENYSTFRPSAYFMYQCVLHLRCFCCFVFGYSQRSVLHKGYLRPSYHGLLSYSKPRTSCVYLGPFWLLPRQQELLQYCYLCLCLFFMCINSPHMNVKKTCKSSIYGHQMVDPWFVQKCLLKLQMLYSSCFSSVPYNKSNVIA